MVSRAMPIHRAAPPRFARMKHVPLQKTNKKGMGNQRQDLHCAAEMTSLFSCWKGHSIDHPSCVKAAQALLSCRSVKVRSFFVSPLSSVSKASD